jgi:hypothetical protein
LNKSLTGLPSILLRNIEKYMAPAPCRTGSSAGTLVGKAEITVYLSFL